MAGMRVVVTAEDIAAPCHSGYRNRTCPVARAVNRELLPGMFAMVTWDGGITIAVQTGDARYDYDMVFDTLAPVEVVRFIQNYDSFRPVEPFEFEL